MPTKRLEQRYEEDPTDHLRREIVGEWAREKHRRLQHYIDISRAARRKFGGNSSYIDVYCGPGRARINGTDTNIDGSAVLAVTEAFRHEPFGAIHIGDSDPINVTACQIRLQHLGVNCLSAYVGKAEVTAAQIVQSLLPSGLHLAFLDPYSIDALPFEVIRTLARLPKMDLLIHVSVMDLQRNVRRLMRTGGLARFAPDWERSVDSTLRNDLAVLAVFRYWRSLLEDLGYQVSDNVERVSGSKNQPLYWLVLAGRNAMADKFWGKISNVGQQTRLF